MKFFEVFIDRKEVNEKKKEVNEAVTVADLENIHLRLQYKIKVADPIHSLQVSKDGNHYIIALFDGSLIIKSKKLEEQKEEMEDDMKMIMNAF